MDLFDFFFPEQAQATHLRKIARQQSLVKVSTPKQKSSEVEDLRADVKFLTLVVAALLRKLSEIETASPGDIQELINELDGLDGVADGGLEPGVLRGLLGVLKKAASESEEATEDFTIRTTPRYRKR